MSAHTFRIRTEEAEYAVPVECTHRKGWLKCGKISRTKHGGCFVTCPLHFSNFDVQTGRQVSGPASSNLATTKLHDLNSGG